MRAQRLLLSFTLSALLVACHQQVATNPPGPEPEPTDSWVPDPPWDPDFQPPGPGNGQDGDLDVTAPTVINTCTRLLSAVNESATIADTSGFAEGHLAVVIQMTDEFAISGDPTPVQGTKAAAWHLGRVVAVETSAIRLDAPLSATFLSAGTRAAQVCTVPEYLNVHVGAGGEITATPWDGETGGVVAFLANGTVTVEGTIDVSGLGFRGGLLSGNACDDHVTALDTTGALGGGKGEGLDARGWLIEGRGNFSSGGGGGNAHNAGGGGGANGGAGGTGGYESAGGSVNTDTQGLGGARIDLALPERLTMGGGGAAGQQDTGFGGAGGAGGGIVLMAVNHIVGNGGIAADGVEGELSGNNAQHGDGAGGGGAGGTLHVEAFSSTFSGLLSAVGGNGGIQTGNNAGAGGREGTGGGGGGGRIYVAGITGATLDVSGGAPGVNIHANDDPWGATAGATGVIVLP